MRVCQPATVEGASLPPKRVFAPVCDNDTTGVGDRPDRGVRMRVDECGVLPVSRSPPELAGRLPLIRGRPMVGRVRLGDGGNAVEPTVPVETRG